MYGFPEKNVTAIMMLYKNTKATVRSSDEDTDFFDIKAGALKGYILAPYFLYSAYVTYFEHPKIYKKEMISYWKRQEADDSPQKL